MTSSSAYFGQLVVTRLLVQRGMATIYLVAFLGVFFQGRVLLGSNGLLPIPLFLKRASFREAPSLFHLHYSDQMLDAVSLTGIALSFAALFGVTDAGPIWLSVAAWLSLYGLYLSIVNTGQDFFGFGWESMLLEAGFFTAFLGPTHTEPSVIPVLVLRWMFFRTELGAGLIKLRHDSCWRDLTCLYYHYETQPLPNPLSWYFHRLPKGIHRFGVLFSHFLQIVCPFGLFAPQPYASIAAALCITQQLWLVVSGNYSWLNWLTVVIGLAGFSDSVLHRFIPLIAAPAIHTAPIMWSVSMWAIGLATVGLSLPPILNLISSRQRMNFSYNRLHLVNTYGAFGSVTRERHEIVLEGTQDAVPNSSSVWKEYGFRGKPGDLHRISPQVAPYHLRLDWMIWFLPFTVGVTPRGIRVRGYEVWFIRFIRKLLTGDPATLKLLGKDPFAPNFPKVLRARFYLYTYTSLAEMRQTGAWWKRQLLGDYLPPVSLDSLPDA